MPSAKGFRIAYIEYSRAFDAFWQGLPIRFGRATRSSVAVVVVQVLIECETGAWSFHHHPTTSSKSFYVPEPRCKRNGWLYHQSSAPLLGSFLTCSIMKTRFFNSRSPPYFEYHPSFIISTLFVRCLMKLNGRFWSPRLSRLLGFILYFCPPAPPPFRILTYDSPFANICKYEAMEGWRFGREILRWKRPRLTNSVGQAEDPCTIPSEDLWCCFAAREKVIPISCK